MELASEVAYPSRLLQIVMPGEVDVRASVIVKQTYEVAPDGSVRRSEVQAPILEEPIRTPLGLLPSEMVPRKGGVDLCVLGSISLSHPTTSTTVALHTSGSIHRMRVVGDRVWQKRWAGISVSEPAAFASMPLTYARAYGGAVPNRAECVHPDNPEGLGFYRSAEEADGRPVANLESTDAAGPTDPTIALPIVGWAPYSSQWGLRARRSVLLSEDKKSVAKLLPEMFSTAHPDLVFSRWSSDWLRIDGARDHSVSAAVPREELDVIVEVGTQRITARAELDGIYWWLDASKLVITRRARFRYQFRAKERRVAVVRPAMEMSR